jgi:hypothetical protein
MLALFIPRENLVKNYNIDVYMAPLLEELQLFWNGVDVWDLTRSVGQ